MTEIDHDKISDAATPADGWEARGLPQMAAENVKVPCPKCGGCGQYMIDVKCDCHPQPTDGLIDWGEKELESFFVAYSCYYSNSTPKTYEFNQKNKEKVKNRLLILSANYSLNKN
jgi:uncharacterized Ntn-hydrolase superfamily protein